MALVEDIAQKNDIKLPSGKKPLEIREQTCPKCGTSHGKRVQFCKLGIQNTDVIS